MEAERLFGGRDVGELMAIMQEAIEKQTRALHEAIEQAVVQAREQECGVLVRYGREETTVSVHRFVPAGYIWYCNERLLDQAFTFDWLPEDPSDAAGGSSPQASPSP